RLADAWRIGQAGLDNGAIIVVVPSARRARIEVGYGLEPVIPDGLAGRIIRERMTPAFASGNYYAGLRSAVEGLSLAARKEYPEAPARPRSSPGLDVGAIFFTYFIVGVLGNAIGIVLGVIAGALIFPFVGGSVAQALGAWAYLAGGFLGLIAVMFLRGFGRTGSWTAPGRHRGGGWSGGFGRGGGFGGGGLGGGGFRGGGGGFGGGGASGSW
ncbi:MAG: TPM domain-containing protein, partial [Vicinamibacteria bacterium]